MRIANFPDYRIVLTTNKTGATEGSINVVVGSTLSLRGVFNTNSISQATNAQYALSYLPWILNSESNSVVDIIDGAAIRLVGQGSARLSFP